MSTEALKRRADELFPKVMYTGTLSGFDEFSTEASGKGSGVAEISGAVWATSDPEVASWFALYPLRNPSNYLLTLIRKSPLATEDPKGLAIRLTERNPELKEAMDAFEETLRQHGIAEDSLIGKWLNEKKLRTEVLERAERVAECFARIAGTRITLAPTVMPLRVNDTGFVESEFGGSSMEANTNRDYNYVGDLYREAKKKGSGGMVLHNIVDGGNKASTVMAIMDYAHIRSAHAAFDPELKNEPGLMN